MKKTITIIAVTAASFLSSWATPVLPGVETSLQSILDTRVTGTSIDVNANQVAGDSYWIAETNPAAYLVIELAGYASNNSFGLYEAGTPSNKMQVFAGSDSGMSGQVTIVLPLSWTAFGFYMENTSAGFTWYSDAALNAGGGSDHFVAYQGAAGATLSGASFDANDFVLAIEDLNLGDQDYNDMVVLVQNVKSVPDGGLTVAFLGFGLLCMLSRYRKFAFSR
jgi:hypothetical protein